VLDAPNGGRGLAAISDAVAIGIQLVGVRPHHAVVRSIGDAVGVAIVRGQHELAWAQVGELSRVGGAQQALRPVE
jgi:hypothetical protein